MKRIPPHVLAPIGVVGLAMMSGCSAESNACIDGYARDADGRCQPADYETANTAPTAPAAVIQPNQPRANGSDLVCVIQSPSIDTDGESIAYSIAWTRNGTVVESKSQTTVFGDTIDGARLMEGDEWSCTITPSDGNSDGPVGSATATVGPGFAGWDDQVVSLSDADYTLIGEANGGSAAGASLAPAGDLDGDGLMDILINDYWWDHPETGADAGKTYVFLAADLGANPQISLSDAAWAFEGEFGRQENDPDCEDASEFDDRCGGDWSGHSIAGGMDGDGDGVSDLLICSYKSDEGAFNLGKAAFYSGALLGPRGVRSIGDADVTLFGENSGDNMGHSVNWAGDVDGDGVADMVTGSHIHGAVEESAGRTYLMLSGHLTEHGDRHLPEAADYIWDGEYENDQSGKRVVHVGDIDGDGMGDIASVALRNRDNGSGHDINGERRGSGKFYILLSSDINATPPGTVASLSDAPLAWMGEEGGDALGYGVDTMGDFDGDGLDDICAGSFGHSENGDASGKSYVITAADMPSDGTRDVANASYGFVGEDTNDWSGLAVASAGDIDRDGRNDITIGAMGHSTPERELAGRAYLFYAGNTEAGTHDLGDADHIFDGERAWDGAGYRTIGPGDMNGDGMPDLVISAWQGDAPDGAAGKVYIMMNPE
ncbi:MAG: hypothetical protein VX127_08900 [Myxococcota bacterium]|nr:hypothetical protein [Myxococcota bacterium]